MSSSSTTREDFSCDARRPGRPKPINAMTRASPRRTAVPLRSRPPAPGSRTLHAAGRGLAPERLPPRETGSLQPRHGALRSRPPAGRRGPRGSLGPPRRSVGRRRSRRRSSPSWMPARRGASTQRTDACPTTASRLGLAAARGRELPRAGRRGRVVRRRALAVEREAAPRRRRRTRAGRGRSPIAGDRERSTSSRRRPPRSRADADAATRSRNSSARVGCSAAKRITVPRCEPRRGPAGSPPRGRARDDAVRPRSTTSTPSRPCGQSTPASRTSARISRGPPARTRRPRRRPPVGRGRWRSSTAAD